MSRTSPRTSVQRTSRWLQQRNRQVESHRGLVAPIASHYAAQSAEAREDLEQVGLLGLIRAAELYDRSLAVPFSAYARQHVRGAILHYLRDTAPLVRPSRRVQEQRHQRNRLAQELLRRLGRIPTSDDLRLALGLSREQWQRQQVEPWQGRLWHDQQWLAAQEPDDADEAEQAAVVLAELEALQKAQRQVVEAVVLEGLSLREVARRMDSSAATVHRQLHRGLQELRTRLTAPADAPAC